MSDVKAEATVSQPLTKTFKCSMTRANKLLSFIKESCSGNGGCSFRGPFALDITYTSLSNISIDSLKTEVKAVSDNYHNVLKKRLLISKWKSKLFETNVKSGISDILAEIAHIKIKIQSIRAILDDARLHAVMSVDKAYNSMSNISTSDKKYDIRWRVTPFDLSDLKANLKSLENKLSKLDENRDILNSNSEFAIELSSDELEMIGEQ